ncbi:MAG: trans-aconitate 2-methyltransferase [Pyrinomonadaceae bacterium]
MSAQTLKERILESSFGYSLWSASVNGQKIAAVRRMLARSGKSGGRVLDVGCGPATNVELLKDWDYVGIDLNPNYIESARAKFPQKRFEVGDATRLAITGEQFDLVFINSIMHHIDDAGCRSLVASTLPLLAAGGVVIVQEPLVPDDGQNLQKFLMKHDRGDYFRTHERWRDLFAEGGLRIAAEDVYPIKIAGVLIGWRMYSALLSALVADADES